MKRYHFTLESALRARRAQEDVARQRLGDANRRLSGARAAYEATVEALRAIAVTADPLDRDAFVAARAQEMRMAEAVQKARRLVAEIEVEAAVCYAAWVDTGKRVASLERLDERRRQEWEADNRREEVAAVDDVVASRWSLASPDGARA